LSCFTGLEWGFRKKGILLAPRDSLGKDPVILKYARDYVKKVEILKEHPEY